MNATKQVTGDRLDLKLEGRLDTNTTPVVENLMKDALTGIHTLVIDCAALAYISSAGLRLLLSMQKTMNAQGAMALEHVNESVMDVLEITGFSDILTIR